MLHGSLMQESCGVTGNMAENFYQVTNAYSNKAITNSLSSMLRFISFQKETCNLVEQKSIC